MTEDDVDAARIVTDDSGGVTVEDATGEFGTFGVGVLAAIVEAVPCSQLPAGTTVARVAAGDAPLSDRVQVQYGTVREHVEGETQVTLAAFSGGEQA